MRQQVQRSLAMNKTTVSTEQIQFTTFYVKGKSVVVISKDKEILKAKVLALNNGVWLHYVTVKKGVFF